MKFTWQQTISLLIIIFVGFIGIFIGTIFVRSSNETGGLLENNANTKSEYHKGAEEGQRLTQLSPALEKPTKLTRDDMSLFQLRASANKVVKENIHGLGDELDCSLKEIVFSKVRKKKQARFFYEPKSGHRPIVTLDCKNGGLLSYKDVSPESGKRKVSKKEATRIAMNFLKLNNINSVPELGPKKKIMDLGAGGKNWVVYWQSSAKDGTPSDSVLSVIVDAVDGHVLSFHSPYGLDANYSSVTCSKSKALNIVRKLHGPKKFDAAQISVFLRVVNCARFDIGCGNKRSVKVWMIL